MGMIFEEIKPEDKHNHSYHIVRSKGEGALELVLFSEEGEVRRWERFYSPGGLLLEERVFEAGGLRTKRIFEDGRLMEELQYADEGLSSSTVYRYAGEKVTAVEAFGATGQSLYREQYLYTKNGSLREMTRWYPDGATRIVSFNFAGGELAETRSLVGEQMYVYRYNTRALISSLEVWHEENLMSSKAWTYHEDSRAVRSVAEVNHSSSTKTTTEFDRDGRKVIERREGVIEEEIRYDYDEDGNLVRETTTTAEGRTRLVYEYGEEGDLETESFYRRGELEKRRIYTSDESWYEQIYMDGTVAIKVYYSRDEKVKEEFIQDGEVKMERIYQTE
jgi:YD repeat-containing protein